MIATEKCLEMGLLGELRKNQFYLPYSTHPDPMLTQIYAVK